MNDQLANQPPRSPEARTADALRPHSTARRALRLTLGGGLVMLLASASCSAPAGGKFDDELPEDGPIPNFGGAGDRATPNANSAGSRTAGAGSTGGKSSAGASGFGGASAGTPSTPPLGSSGSIGTPPNSGTGGFGSIGGFASSGGFASGSVQGGSANGGEPNPAVGGSTQSSSGSSGSSGTGGTTMLGECTPGTRRCDATGRIAQNCGPDAYWQDTACPFVCSNDACSGVCQPGQRQCNGAQPQRCTDQGTWMTDGSPCPAQCEGGICTGACRNGATQCITSQSLQSCGGGQWGSSMSCEFACVQNQCGGVCSPGTTHCASGNEIETCSQTGQWNNRRACNFVCAGDSCGGVCRPNDRKCKNGTQEQRCNAQGQWEDGQVCDFACVNNTCGGVCDPGATRCKSAAQLEVCNTQGQWEARSCPNNACANNACSTCRPADTRCTSTTQVQECTAKGEWGSATKTCPFACTDGVCSGECKPGATATECDHSSQLLQKTSVCNDTGDWEDVQCSSVQSCQKGVCGQHRRTIFITDDIYFPTGGLSNLDGKCREAASEANLGGSFKAFLADSKTDIFERFKMEGGPFRTPGGTIVAFNWQQLLDGDLQNLIDENQHGSPSIPLAAIPASSAGICSGKTNLVWANIRDGGSTAGTRATDNCNDWTSSGSNGTAYFGDRGSKTQWKYSCNPIACNTRAPLICIQE